MGGAGQPGYGPLWRIDGPPPIPPRYGLLPAANSPSAGVRVVPDVDPGGRERWINGVEVYPYPPDCPLTFDACAPASEAYGKEEGTNPTPPQFSAITLYQPVHCTSRGVGDQRAYTARAVQALEAKQTAALETELLTGAALSFANPHLADGNGTFPYDDNITSPINGIALLEAEIAESCIMGLIHVSPQMAAFLRDRWVLDDRDGVLRTINGNVVIPGFGYVLGATPAGHTEALEAENQEWIYASGPVDIRLSAVFVVPENVSEAVDRSTNDVIYRAERYALVTWDTVVQAAVLVDRCRTTC